MKIAFQITLLLLVVFMAGCASVQQSMYSRDKAIAIKNWRIDFEYEHGLFEEQFDNKGDSAVRVVRKGHSSSDLQLLDDVYFILKDNPAFNVTKKKEKEYGLITLNSVEFYSGGYKATSVVFYDSNGETLGRLKIKNGDRNATFMDDDDYAKYVAKSISNFILSE